MERASTKSPVRSAARTRSIAYVGLTMAIMAVSAWITVPLGPVPFTLQMFALTFAIVVLTPSQCMAAVAGYLVLGAIGVPVFSGMRGGIGVLAGPTGGFLWGYLLGAGAAVLLLQVVRSRRTTTKTTASDAVACVSTVDAYAAEPARENFQSMRSHSRFMNGVAFLRVMGLDIAAGLLFTAVAYVCGWAQFMAVAGVSPEAAFLIAIAPFVVVDIVKVVAAAVCARAVKAAMR